MGTAIDSALVMIFDTETTGLNPLFYRAIKN